MLSLRSFVPYAAVICVLALPSVETLAQARLEREGVVLYWGVDSRRHRLGKARLGGVAWRTFTGRRPPSPLASGVVSCRRLPYHRCRGACATQGSRDR